jgi:ATP-dependent Zn protease
MFGKKKLQMLNEKQKEYRITYQAGKVITATYFDLPFEKLMLSNEKLTPTTGEPLIKQEIEARIKMLLAGIVACDVKYNEHGSGAKSDLAEAKEFVESMCEDYGMCSSLIPKADEKEIIMRKLYDECRDLLSSMPNVMQSVEVVLRERESITKNEVKQYLNAVL